MDWFISFLVIYELFCLVLGSSDGMLTWLNFVFWNGQKVFDVINVCCCCCLILLFVLTRFLNIVISQQFNASILTPLSYLFSRLSYLHTQFFWKILGLFWVFSDSQKTFFGFSICSSFGRQLCQNCGWAGSEPYVPLHIAEPPCFFLQLMVPLWTAFFQFLDV